ncbi:MAG: transposase [Flavobacteriales bacterium]|nr:transposase [Flavobacteriales bacterium]
MEHELLHHGFLAVDHAAKVSVQCPTGFQPVVWIHQREAGGTLPSSMLDIDLLFDPFEEVSVRHRNLPHWRQEGKLYFVTWRQADSIAKEKRDELRREREAFIKAYGDPATTNLTELLLKRYNKLFHERVQRWLDAGNGSCVLRYPEARRIMRDALHHFNGTRYELGSFAIAGNHVHVLVVPSTGFELSDILHSWKSFTANAINRAIGHKGILWQDESHDHLVRSEASLDRIAAYILAHEEQGALVERREL